jgi:hypothetical protein
MSGERNLLAEQAGMNDIANDVEKRRLAELAGMSSPVGMVDLSATAGNISTSLKGFMAFEPMVAGMVSMFFPPAAIAQPFIVMAMPFLIRALDDIQKNNGGDMIGAFLELAQHLTKGGTNSPVLSAVKQPDGSFTVPGTNLNPPSSDDPSRQGSG